MKLKLSYLKIFVFVIIIFTSLISGCKKTEAYPIEIPSNAKAGEIVNFEPCKHEVNDVEYAADCGQLIVPENRTNPDSRNPSSPCQGVLGFQTTAHRGQVGSSINMMW